MKPILICIAGGTASGKTTVVQKVKAMFSNEDLSVIETDNYYKDLSHLSLEDRKKVNYDHPNSVDLDLVYKHLCMLLAGKYINMPVYDFKEHNRVNNKYITLKPTKIILFEGIFALYDERIRNLASIKLFVESDSDIRFIRRLTRDIKERGRSMEEVIKQYLATVKPSYDVFIAPTKRYADIIIPNDFSHEVAVDFIAARLKDLARKEE